MPTVKILQLIDWFEHLGCKDLEVVDSKTNYFGLCLVHK